MSSVSEDAPVHASVLDGVAGPIVQWNRIGRVTAWNRAAVRLFGFSREEALGTLVDRFLGPAYRGTLTKVWPDFEAHGESFLHCQILTRAGDRVLTEWHSVPLTAPDGAIDGASATVVAPRAIARLQTPAGGAEPSLTIGAVVADTPKEARSVLASGVAHEFMNVFAVILSYAKFIEAASQDDFRQIDAQQIAKSATLGACMTRHLLSIAGLGSSQGLLDVNATLVAMVAAISSGLGGARELSVTPSEEPLHLEMDWAEFDRMLLDLTLTACRTMPRVERFRIHAERTLRPDASSGVRISIAPHFDARNEPTSLGVDVSCCEARRIAESAGGVMDVRGDELFVELPYRGVSVSTPFNGGVRAQPIAAQRREAVFVLEDEPGIREALVRVLELAGYDVRAGDSVATARAELESGFAPDLIVCDLSLPDGSSTQLLEWLRRERPALYERAIVLTGGAVTTADRSYIRKNALRVLNKPIGPGSLLSALAEARGEPRPAVAPRGEGPRSASVRARSKEAP